VFVAISAVVLAAAKRTPPPFVLGGIVWAWLAVAATALAGVVVALAAQPPRDPLHIVYGVIAVAALPGTALIARGRGGSSQAIVWAIGGIVFVILVMRLFQTAT
jgi:hypothetical protein